MLGPQYSSLAQPFTVGTGITDLTATVSRAGGAGFMRLDQGSGWGGNFAPATPLLWTASGGGPVTFSFSAMLAGFGTQIQTNNFGAFGATIAAYDASDLLLGEFTLDGTSSGDADDSALFIGIQSGSANIARITLVAGNGDFAINQATVSNAAATVTPEPGTWALLGTGLLAVGAMAAQRRRAA